MASYDMEIKRLISLIAKEKPKRMCIQLPDGLKPRAREIVDAIRGEIKNPPLVLIWLGTDFGACDLPLGLKALNVDLLVTYGHNEFIRKEGWA